MFLAEQQQRAHIIEKKGGPIPAVSFHISTVIVQTNLLFFSFFKTSVRGKYLITVGKRLSRISYLLVSIQLFAVLSHLYYYR